MSPGFPVSQRNRGDVNSHWPRRAARFAGKPAPVEGPGRSPRRQSGGFGSAGSRQREPQALTRKRQCGSSGQVHSGIETPPLPLKRPRRIGAELAHSALPRMRAPAPAGPDCCSRPNPSVRQRPSGRPLSSSRRSTARCRFATRAITRAGALRRSLLAIADRGHCRFAVATRRPMACSGNRLPWTV